MKKIYRQGVVETSKRWGGGIKVAYKIEKSPQVLLGASLFLKKSGRGWKFASNVRPSISRGRIKEIADSFFFTRR